MLKILMISPCTIPFPPVRGGGVEAHIWNLTKSLAKLGNEIQLVGSVYDSKSVPTNVTLSGVAKTGLPFRMGFYGWTINLLIGGILSTANSFYLARRNEFDIIHSHEVLSTIFLSKSGKLLRNNVPKILTVHSPSLLYKAYSGVKQFTKSLAFEAIITKAWKCSDHLIALNRTLINELSYSWKIPPKKISLVPHGVDVETFNPEIKGVREIKAKYGLAMDEEYCIFVGHLSQRKGIEYLLKALATMDLCCVIVGDGPLKGPLLAMSRKLSLSNRVFLVGNVHQRDLARLYAGASFFVFPSLSEASPVVPLEAMASGLPVIMTKIPGAIDIVKHGDNGFLVHTADVKELKESIRILREDDSLRRRMGLRARKLAEENFSWEKVAIKTMDVYDSLVSR